MHVLFRPKLGRKIVAEIRCVFFLHITRLEYRSRDLSVDNRCLLFSIKVLIYFHLSPRRMLIDGMVLNLI